jgi:DNA gyrase subunit B
VEKQKATDIMKISVAMQYTKEDENNSQIEFLNGSNLIHHGTIYDGLVNGIRKTIDKYLKNNGKYNKNEKSIKSEDILQGLNYIINFKSYFPVYANQTKFASYVVYYKDIMQNFIENQLEIYFIENKEIAEKITTQILINKRAREKSEQTRTDIKKKLESNISITNRIEGLIECKSKNKENNILCICEGKSALSAMISGRQDIHALFPIRGKILNCLKAPLDKILSNDVVLNLIKALGCGIEIKSNKKDMITFDISKLRYSKICIYVDADFDGMGSILPLLLTVFWKLTPTLVREGRIYVCETPKYEIVAGDKYYYAVDDKELESIQNKLKGKKYNLHYIKGLSELSAETMAMCLKPDYKNITKVGLGDVKKSIEMLELFMGNDVAPRRDYIISNFDVGD